MNRLSITLAIMFLWSLAAWASEPLDYAQAQEWCDSQALEPIEGIWTFSEDRVEVLIRRTQGKALREYEVVVLSDPSLQLQSGQVIGKVTGGSDASQYLLVLRERAKGLKPARKLECLATLGKFGDTLRVQRNKRVWEINVLGFLPRFRRILRTHSENPASQMPVGLVKLYPSYDDNGSSSLIPRYL